MNDAPKLRCFSSQLVSDWQLAESPAKLYPRYGVTNPSALAGTAAAAKAARVNPTNFFRTNPSALMIAQVLLRMGLLSRSLQMFTIQPIVGLRLHRFGQRPDRFCRLIATHVDPSERVVDLRRPSQSFSRDEGEPQCIVETIVFEIHPREIVRSDRRARIDGENFFVRFSRLGLLPLRLQNHPDHRPRPDGSRRAR